MGQLITPHTVLPIFTTPIAIAVFLGLAIYVITCNPRRPISWVFILLCLTIAGIYIHSLFMTSQLPLPSIPDFLIRGKWAVIAVSSTLYLHLLFFYFPPTWQRYRFWALLLAYNFSIGVALITLFTNLFVAGHVYDPTHYTINPLPGPFLIFYTGFFMLEIVGSAVGLIINYRLTQASPFRHQITYLLMPAGLVLLGSLVYWLTILTHTTEQIPHELPDALLILAAILYARSVVSYGLFIDRPLALRNLFYSTLATIAGVSTLFLTMKLDQWLMNYTPLPYYLVTGISILIVATSFPTLNQWVTTTLDKWFFQAEHQEQNLAHCLAQVLAQVSNPAQRQVELLEALRMVLRVDKGYIALAAPELPPSMLAVQVIQGNLPLQPGELIRRPPLYGEESQLVALLPQLQTETGWQDIALFCPLNFNQEIEGVLALGEKRDKKSFRGSELFFCAELIKQLTLMERMLPLHVQRSHYLEAAQLQQQTRQRLGAEAISLSGQMPTAVESYTAPLQIRVLGPLQVTRHGQLIPEAAWGSEKAKALLAYLLWKSPAGVTREELCQALWPHRSTDTANVFHVTLHLLRRVLQTEPGQDKDTYIQHNRGYYRFNTDAPHWLDLTAFQALITSDDLIPLQAAVELYQGSYLKDMVWVLPVEVEVIRRQLEQLYADALRRLAAQASDRQALLYLEKLLAVEPADEIAHRSLVLGYLARGRGDLARRQVERWRQALAEFDLEASAETVLLWQSVTSRSGNQSNKL